MLVSNISGKLLLNIYLAQCKYVLRGPAKLSLVQVFGLGFEEVLENSLNGL